VRFTTRSSIALLLACAVATGCAGLLGIDDRSIDEAADAGNVDATTGGGNQPDDATTDRSVNESGPPTVADSGKASSTSDGGTKIDGADADAAKLPPIAEPDSGVLCADRVTDGNVGVFVAAGAAADGSASCGAKATPCGSIQSGIDQASKFGRRIV